MTWKTAGQLVRECVARLERKGLGTVADAAPSQVRAGEISAGQTVDGGSRVIGIRGRAILCFVGFPCCGTGTDLTHWGSTSIFPRDSARVRGGDRQPVVLIVVIHFGPHRRAAASVAQEGQRSGE
jgi:hypothetical protein